MKTYNFKARFIELYNYDIWDYLCSLFEKSLHGKIQITNNLYANCTLTVYQVSAIKFNSALRCYLNHYGYDYIETMADMPPYGYTRVKRIVEGVNLQSQGTYNQTVHYYLQQFLNQIANALDRQYDLLPKKLIVEYYKEWIRFNRLDLIFTVNNYEIVQAVVNKLERAGALVLQHVQAIQWKR